MTRSRIRAIAAVLAASLAVLVVVHADEGIRYYPPFDLSIATGTLPNAHTTATSANTASTIVARDGSGNFSATTISAAVTGNSSTATALATNGANCSANTYPLGVDASGAAESCSAVSLTAGVSGVLPFANGGGAQVRGRFTVSASAGAFTCDLSLGDWCAITTGNGANTATLSNPTSGMRYLFTVIQPSSGAAGTVTWPGTVHWPGAVAPTLTTTNAQVDLVACAWNGTSHFCESSLNFAP